LRAGIARVVEQSAVGADGRAGHQGEIDRVAGAGIHFPAADRPFSVCPAAGCRCGARDVRP